MPVAWYIAPYKRDDTADSPTRYCAMDDYTANILASGGKWTETEILGDRAIVKVRASVAVLQTLNGVFKRLPKDLLDDSLSSLTTGQKNALRNEALDQGYTLAEIQARFGNDLGQYTLKPRYDIQNNLIVLDGDIQSCRSIESVDAEVE
jgi:hypothetical protein